MPDEKTQAEAARIAKTGLEDFLAWNSGAHLSTVQQNLLIGRMSVFIAAALDGASLKQADEMSQAFNAEIAGLQARHKAERESASKQNGALLALIIDRLQEAGGTLDDKLRWQIVMDLQQDIRQGDETASQWWLDTFADLKKERESASKREANDLALIETLGHSGQSLNRLLVERNAQIAELTKREAELQHAADFFTKKLTERDMQIAELQAKVQSLTQERDALLGNPDAVHQGALAAIAALRQCRLESASKREAELEQKVESVAARLGWSTDRIRERDSQIAELTKREAEPGSMEARMEYVWKVAEKYGHPAVSSKDAIVFLDELIAELTKREAELMAQIARLRKESADRADAIRDMVPNHMRLWAPLEAVKMVVKDLAERDAQIAELQARVQKPCWCWLP